MENLTLYIINILSGGDLTLVCLLIVFELIGIVLVLLNRKVVTRQKDMKRTKRETMTLRQDITFIIFIKAMASIISIILGIKLIMVGFIVPVLITFIYQILSISLLIREYKQLCILLQEENMEKIVKLSNQTTLILGVLFIVSFSIYAYSFNEDLQNENIGILHGAKERIRKEERQKSREYRQGVLSEIEREDTINKRIDEKVEELQEIEE